MSNCMITRKSGGEQISLVFSDGHVEYFSKNKFKKGSTTTRPFIPITAEVSTNKSFGKTSAKESAVTFNDITVVKSTSSLGETTGSVGAMAKNIYLPFLCSDVENLKEALFKLIVTGSGGSYSVTYTSWIEQ